MPIVKYSKLGFNAKVRWQIMENVYNVINDGC